MFKDFIEIQAPTFIDTVLSDVEQIKTIFVVDQTIRKHSQDLMEPQSDDLILGADSFLVRHADTEVHSGEVSQVEKIVGFCGSRQELFH